VKARGLLTLLVCLFAISCDAGDAAHTHSDVVEHTHSGDAGGAGGAAHTHPDVVEHAPAGACAMGDHRINLVFCWDTVSILTCLYGNVGPWITGVTCEELCNEAKKEAGWTCVINGYMTCSPELEEAEPRCNTCPNYINPLGECIEPD
jgi:hypothetical protein